MLTALQALADERGRVTATNADICRQLGWYAKKNGHLTVALKALRERGAITVTFTRPPGLPDAPGHAGRTIGLHG